MKKLAMCQFFLLIVFRHSGASFRRVSPAQLGHGLQLAYRQADRNLNGFL
jgi:hypothetical protein